MSFHGLNIGKLLRILFHFLLKMNSLFALFTDIGQLRMEITSSEEISRQLFLELHSLKNMQERERWSATLKGKYFNVIGHFFSLYCVYKIFMVTTIKLSF